MTKYLQKSFSVGGYSPNITDESWDRIFGDTRQCVVCGKRFRSPAGDPSQACPKCMTEPISAPTS